MEKKMPGEGRVARVDVDTSQTPSKSRTHQKPERQRDRQPASQLPELSKDERSFLTRSIDLERRTRQMRGLWRLSRHVSSGLSDSALLSLATKIAVQTLDAEAASLQLYNPTQNALVFHAVEDPLAAGLQGHTIPTTFGIGAGVLRTGEPNITRNVQESPDYNASVEKKTGRHIESLLTVPIPNKSGGSLGVLQVLTGMDEFWDYDLEFLRVLATLTSYPLTLDYKGYIRTHHRIRCLHSLVIIVSSVLQSHIHPHRIKNGRSAQNQTGFALKDLMSGDKISGNPILPGLNLKYLTP